MDATAAHFLPPVFYPPPGLHLAEEASASGERTPDFLATCARPREDQRFLDEFADGAATPRGFAEPASLTIDALKDKLRQLELGSLAAQCPPQISRMPPPRAAPSQWGGLGGFAQAPMTFEQVVPPPPPAPPVFAPSNRKAKAPAAKFIVSFGSVGHPTQCAEMCDREVCEAGAECRRCHLCRADQAVQEARLQSEVAALTMCPSVGSMGHPTACGEACKFISRGRGCKDGSNCTRCHLCRWSRYRSNHPRRGPAPPAPQA